MGQRQENENRLLRYNEICREISSFLSGYGVKESENGLYKIKERLYEYERICAEITREAESLDEYAISHGIDKDIVNRPQNEVENVGKFDTGLLSAKINELSREEALKKRSIVELESELARESEYQAQLLSLTEKSERKKYVYGIIEHTKKFLTQAGDALSERYLEKAKGAFLKYIELCVQLHAQLLT